MGRRTYDVFAPAWSSRSGDPYTDRINAMRKVVVSTTLTDPEWANTEVVAGDVAGRVRDLKAEAGGDIVQYGFGDVSRLLLDAGLRQQATIIDQLNARVIYLTRKVNFLGGIDFADIGATVLARAYGGVDWVTRPETASTAALDRHNHKPCRRGLGRGCVGFWELHQRRRLWQP